MVVLPPADDEDINVEESFNMLYRKCAENYNWSLPEIENTNLESLLDFLFLKNKSDPDIRIIDGKTYRRATKPPSWL